MFCLPLYEGRNHSEFLGIGYLSASLKKAGHETLILDENAAAFVAKRSADLNSSFWVREWIKKRITEFIPDVLAVTINTTNYRNALNLLSFLKSNFPEVFIIVGGPHITCCYDSFSRFHRDCFDAAVSGEGETAVLKVLSDFAVSGIRQPVKLYKESLLNSLDVLPFPDRDGFYQAWAAEKRELVREHYADCFYTQLPGFRGRKFARVVVSRGCDHACNFCSASKIWIDGNDSAVRRVRTPESVYKEVNSLARSGVNAIYFDDPTFPLTSNLNFVNRFCELIQASDLKINFGLVTRAEEIDERSIKAFAAIGLKYLYFGLENIDSDKLRKMGKNTEHSKSFNALKICENHGVYGDVSYQVGFPGLSRDEMLREFDRLAELFPNRNVFFSLTAVWPKTKLALESGLSGDDYEPSADKEKWAAKGLYYFEPGNPKIEIYYSNCSGTYHFIDEETAIWIKEQLIDREFIKRFDRIKQ
ncbi:MAG: radical SAM protein [Candidatus Wallbacteria bacterium]|nr:radical SAM protein [Candidatus Wallbacteria bacterium]